MSPFRYFAVTVQGFKRHVRSFVWTVKAELAYHSSLEQVQTTEYLVTLHVEFMSDKPFGLNGVMLVESLPSFIFISDRSKVKLHYIRIKFNSYFKGLTFYTHWYLDPTLVQSANRYMVPYLGYLIILCRHFLSELSLKLNFSIALWCLYFTEIVDATQSYILYLYSPIFIWQL